MSAPDPRVALVIGASRGIGASVARAFARTGAAVVLAARDTAALDALAADIRRSGGRATAVPTDVTDPAAVSALVDTTMRLHGRLDAAVNAAAGGGHRPTPLAEVAVDDFDTALAVSLRGVFLAMRCEVSAMAAGGGGAIVNISSTAALHPVAGLAGYVTAKAALIGLTRVAALDHASDNVRVNALAPGPIETEHLVAAGAAVRARIAATLPVGRLGRPDEVAAAALWLCGPQAAFITGATLPIDGGLIAGMPPYGTGRPMTATSTTGRRALLEGAPSRTLR